MKKCPECGAKTIVEIYTDHIGSFKERRCTGLVEIDVNKPLEACGWSEYVGDNQEQPYYFGVGIETPAT
jgi:hypothetical protein